MIKDTDKVGIVFRNFRIGRLFPNNNVKSMEIDIVFITALAATILFSISTVFSKFLITDLKNPLALLRIQISLNLVVAFIPLIIYYLLVGNDIFQNVTFENILLIGMSGLFIFSGLLLFYYGLLVGNTSAAGVITSSRVILSVLFGYFLFEEYFPISYYFWIVVIFLGVFFVSWSADLSITDILLFRANGSGIFVSSVTLWAIGNIFTRMLNNTVNTPILIVIRLIIMTLASVLTYPIFLRYTKRFITLPTDDKITKYFVRKMITYLIVFTSADLFITFALGESLTITETIVALQSVLIFLIILTLSYFNAKLRDILGEGLDRKTILVRGLGVITALFGTIFLILS